jgi:hypothetical protein
MNCLIIETFILNRQGVRFHPGPRQLAAPRRSEVHAAGGLAGPAVSPGAIRRHVSPSGARQRMFSSTWRNSLRQLAQAIQGGRRRRSCSPARRFRCLEREWLEARVVPTVATTLAVNPYRDVSLVPPLQPDGNVVTPALDSRILKVSEQNNLLVAMDSVSVSPTENDAHVPGRGRPAGGRALASGLRRPGSAGNLSRNVRRQRNSHKPNRFSPDTFLPIHRSVQERPRFLGRIAERLFRRCTTY